LSNSHFIIHILGANSAKPPIGLNQTSQLLTIGEGSYLLDCGEGTQFRLDELRLKQNRIKAIFISHLHGDHYLGLMGLLSSMSMNHRTADLHIFAPKGLIEILTVQMHFTEFFPEFELNFKEVNSVSLEKIYEDKQIIVESFPLSHRLPCWGFLIREKIGERRIIAENIPENFPYPFLAKIKNSEIVVWNEQTYHFEDISLPPLPPRKYAFCTDTLFLPHIAQWIAGADLLYHDATFETQHEIRANETYHATSAQAAQLAEMSGVKKLLIGHFSSRYANYNKLLVEAKAIFENTELAIQGNFYPIFNET